MFSTIITLRQRILCKYSKFIIEKGFNMSATPSNMLELGKIAPSFNLSEPLTGKMVSLDSIKSDKATVIMFTCNHCPFVLHVNDELVRLGNDYKEQGVSFVAISSNDVDNYPQDSPEKMAGVAEKLAYPFPYLYDETQGIAKAYKAACTPDFYIFDKEMKLVYRGQLDDSRPGNSAAIDGKDIRAALDSILAGKEVNPEQIPSIGCNIKWK
jgi:thiol-disulfide isomerase/thioredoxin